MTISLYLSLFQINKSREMKSRSEITEIATWINEFGEELRDLWVLMLERMKVWSFVIRDRERYDFGEEEEVSRVRFGDFDPVQLNWTRKRHRYAQLRLAAVTVNRSTRPLRLSQRLLASKPHRPLRQVRIGQGVEYFQSGLRRPLWDTAVTLEAYFSSSRLVAAVCLGRCGWPLWLAAVSVLNLTTPRLMPQSFLLDLKVW